MYFRFSGRHLDLLLPVTSDNVGCLDDMFSELNVLENIGVDIGISTKYSLEDEIHKPAIKVDR